MSKTNRSKEVLGNDDNEGTAARTRPFSYEEIMLRRKKKLAADVKETAPELRESSEKVDVKGDLNRLKADGVSKNMKELKGAVNESSNKIEERLLRKNGDKFDGKDGSNKIEERLFRKTGDKFEGKDKARYEEAKMKRESMYDMSNRDRASKNEKHAQPRIGIASRSGGSFEKDSDKRKMSKTYREKDKHEEREKKSKHEQKRKHHSHIEEKGKFDADASATKKHDSGRLKDFEYSNIKERKKEHSQTYHEEVWPKRRRSRSREFDRERDRRSVSVSPRAQKRHHHERDTNEPFFSKDKPRRKYSDTDKYRSSGNGGYERGYYRKHGSGLGGYSPRKRRTEAAVETPSPTIRSPERKSATWDLPPGGASHAGSGLLPSATRSQELVVSTSTTSATTGTQPSTSADIASVVISMSIDSVQLTQATRPMRRLYVENLPPSASEKALIDCLNESLMSSGANHIKGTNPCISCIINKDKCQALVEFLTPEDAVTALSFDGKLLSGCVLKIRRPKDFVVEAATGSPVKPVSVVEVISDVVGDSPSKIFIGGISEALSSDMFLSIVTAFGHLRAFHFMFSPELNGSCAFLEYIDHAVTLKACAGLNGMKLGGCVLTAIQATPDAHEEEEDAERDPCYDVPLHAKPLLADPTKVLQLRNVFDEEEMLLLSESELEETLEDIRLECARFGHVKSLNVVRYGSNSISNIEASGQDTHQDPIKTGTKGASPSSVSVQNGHDPPANDNIEELEGVAKVPDDRAISDEKPIKDLAGSEQINHLEGDGADIHEDTLQVADPLTNSDDGVALMVEEDPSLKNDLASEPPNLEERGTMLADDKNITFGEDRVDASKGDGKSSTIEDKNLETVAVEKADAHHQAGAHHTDQAGLLEPGCVLVEFLRVEATCTAAHCLHGRSYGERTVAAAYVPHDLYLARFPR